MARMAEERTHSDFRDRARMEYEERRAEKRLGPAQLTCVTLDEKAGREVSVWSSSSLVPCTTDWFVNVVQCPVAEPLECRHVP